jgi:redox-sensitive bicupin YhaK (pirin superfamily)
MESKLESIHTPEPHQGFLGPGHIARAVVGGDFSKSDPFIALMDDRIVVPEGKSVGGPHPHAGFETVTMVLEGDLGNEQHGYHAGDFEMMTAGKGIIHTESIEPGTTVKILQLWLTLPRDERWAPPRIQRLRSDAVPQVRKDGATVRVYSGSFAGLTSPVRNYVPVTIAHLKLEKGASTEGTLPAAFNGFVYVIDGEVSVGADIVGQDQVAWFARVTSDADRALKFSSKDGATLVLYAGLPQGDKIVSYGPFIGDTQRDIVRLYEEYHQGSMKHVSTLPQEQVLSY